MEQMNANSTPPGEDRNSSGYGDPVAHDDNERKTAGETESADTAPDDRDTLRPEPEKGSGDVREKPAGTASGETAALNDRILRLAAELENTRRRLTREKADAGRYAIANFARDLLGVVDNFDRAIRVSENEDSGKAVSGLVDGIRMVEKELLAILERHGIRRMDPQREKFDPALHQAVAQLPHADIPSGHVVDVAQPGFTLADRILRAAMVTVSTGPATTPAPEDTGRNSGMQTAASHDGATAGNDNAGRPESP